VSVTCEMIFFDGTETRGASSVDVTVKFGQLTNVLSMRVWIPELPLDIDLSDSKLSQIYGWKVPTSDMQQRRRFVFTEYRYVFLFFHLPQFKVSVCSYKILEVLTDCKACRSGFRARRQ
jgi:Transmembrane protein family 132